MLMHEHASAGLALLQRDLFSRANAILGAPAYQIDLISAGGRKWSDGDVTLVTGAPSGRYHFVIVPPLSEVNVEQLRFAPRDVNLVRAQYEKGACIASACLGSFLIASAGLLVNRKATTHWRWSAYASRSYADVEWRPSQMICDERSVITAGGYLGAVDLCLYLVARTQGKELAHELGQIILADSARQKQSVYARELIQPCPPGSALEKLAHWVSTHLDCNPTVAEMAKLSAMSLRDFHRKFRRDFGVSPRKYVQLRRIEKSQELLRTTELSVEEIIDRVGVSDIASFRKIFQRELGISPAEYRRKLRT